MLVCLAAGIVLAMGGLAQAALTNGLVAYYPLEATSGLTATDEVGGNDGTLAGQFDGDNGWTTGKIGGGLEFKRYGRDNPYPDTTNIGWIDANDLLETVNPTTGVLNDTDSYTFSAWAEWAPKLGGDSNWGYAIWGANTAVGDNGNVIRIGANKTADGVFTRTDHTFGANTVDWTDEAWHLLTLAFDPNGNGNADWYVDGSLVVSKDDDPGLDREKAWSTATLFHFGMEMEGNQATDGWSGKLDELAIWNRELSAQEISDLYNDGDGVSLLDTGLLGDADENGVVNAADYMTVKGNMGQSVGGVAADGDFNDNGTVDYADLQTLIDGINGQPGNGPAFSDVVPEPATLFVLMAAGLPALLKRRQRRS